MSAMHARASVTSAGAGSLDSKHLKRMRTVLPTARIHIAVVNKQLRFAYVLDTCALCNDNTKARTIFQVKPLLK